MTHTMRIATASFLVLVALGVRPNTQVPEDPELWTYQSEQDIKHFELIPSGDLFVSTNEAAFVVSALTGTVDWVRDDIRDCSDVGAGLVRCRYLDERGYLVFLAGTPYAALNTDDVAIVLDWRSGSTVFNSVDHPLGKVIDLRHVPATDQLLLYTEVEKQQYALSAIQPGEGEPSWVVPVPLVDDFQWVGFLDDGTAYAYGKGRNNQHLLVEIDLAAGEFAWSRSDLLKEKPRRSSQPPFRDEDGALIMFLTKDGPMRVSRAGELLWRADELSGEDPSPIIHSDGMLYLYQDEDVFAVAAGTGELVWTYASRSGSDPVGLEVNSSGLLVFKGGGGLELLDLSSGTAIWSDPDAKLQGPRVVEGINLYIADKERLAFVDIPTGTVTSLAQYKLEGKEAPTEIELVDDQFLLSSPQNLARYDRDGKELFRRYFKRPGASGWAKFGAAALQGGVFGGILDEKIRSDRSRLDRYQDATIAVDRFFYFYVENSGGDDAHKFRLVRVNGKSGQEAGELWINERNPRYAIDPGREKIFFRENETIIRLAQFEPSVQ